MAPYRKPAARWNALGADAARHGPDVRASFEDGIQAHIKLLRGWIGARDGQEPDGRAMAVLATMVGAVLLARAVNDPEMSKHVLAAAADSVMAKSSNGETHAS